jgi:hypothetical protein
VSSAIIWTGQAASYLCLIDFLTESPQPNLSRLKEDFGIVSERYVELIHQSDSYLNRNPEPGELLTDNYGLFSFLDAVLRFYQENSKESLSRLAQLMPLNSQSISDVPFHLFRDIPFEQITSLKLALENITSDEVEVDQIFSSAHLNTTLEINAPKKEKKLSTVDWRRLVKAHPAVSMTLYFANLHSLPISLSDKPRFVNPLIEAILENPKILNQIAATKWGRLLNLSNKKQTAKVRSAFVQAAKTHKIETRLEPFFWHRNFDFKLDCFEVLLPSELSLVPIILESIVNFDRQRGSKRGIGNKFLLTNKESNESLSNLFLSFFSDPKQIVSQKLNTTAPTLNDAYLMLLRVMHKDIEESLLDFLEFIPAVLAISPDQNFLRILLHYILSNYPDENPEILRLVSTLMDITADDFSLREEFTPLLKAWREKSKSPATKIGAIEDWI